MTHKKHDYAPRTRTSIYVEGYTHAATLERVQELNSAGFDVFYDSGQALIVELLRMVLTDTLLVFVDNASNFTWMKIGFAVASGLRIVAIGKSDPGVPVALQVPAWSDLSRNCFLKMGDMYYKKPASANKYERPKGVV